MKNKVLVSYIFTKIIFLILAFAAFCLASCSELVSGEVYEKNDISRYMYITLDSGDSTLALKTSSRSITPNPIDLSNSLQNYYFYIWGKSQTGNFSPKKVDFESSSNSTGTVYLDFPVTSYAFTLAVTDTEITELTSSTIIEKAIFIGYTQADLTYSKTVKFNLSTNGLSAPGKAFLNFYLDSDSWTDEQVSRLLANYTVRVGLFNSNGSAQTAQWGLENLSKTTAVSSQNYFSSIVPGTYDMQVTFYERGGIYQVGIYSDKIVILPNRTINADIYLPNVLLDLPACPTNFKAAYCMDYRFYTVTKRFDNGDGTASTQYGLSLTSNDQIEEYDFNTYGLLFSWQDNSNNETGFKITIADLSKIYDGVLLPSELVASVPSTMTDEFWKQYVEPYQGQSEKVRIFTPDNYSSSLDYFAGSLEKNKTSLIVYGTFGSCYIAKIEAINSAGISQACYVTLDEDFNAYVDDENYTNNTAVYAGSAFSAPSNPCRVMNRYKISYYLCDGKISYTYGPNTVISSKTWLVKYYTYGESSIDCYTAADTAEGTIDSPALIYYGNDTSLTGKRWNRWQFGSYGGTDLIDILGGSTVTVDENYSYQKAEPYTGYSSIYLFARYD